MAITLIEQTKGQNKQEQREGVSGLIGG